MSSLQFFGAGLPYIPPHDCPGALITLEGTDGVGRTTQMIALREWLEVQGYGVVETGWTRSPLIGRTITQAKEGRALNKFTYSLLYAADFADRLEREIIPALRSGFIVLADRYVFTAFARDMARGVDGPWVRDLFGFAPKPHLVVYLKIDVNTLIRRVVQRGPIDYFEGGMDMAMGKDPFDSFKLYQTRLIREYNRLAEEFGWVTFNAKLKPENIQQALRKTVSEFLSSRKMPNARESLPAVMPEAVDASPREVPRVSISAPTRC